MPARRLVDVDERRARLAVRHRLVPARRTDDVTAIADDLVALHSSDPVTVYLSATSRMRTPSLAAMDDALYEHRSLLRHHAMRRTLWVFSPEIARLCHHAATVGLLGPERRRTLAMLGTSDVIDEPGAWLDAAAAEILDVLTETGPLTARELGQLLPHRAVPITIGSGRFTATQAAHTRVLLMMGFTGEVLRARPTGSWINGQYRWAATPAWFPEGFDDLDPRTARAGLTRRWLRAFGPATRTDLQWWAKWTVAATTRALADVGAVEVDLGHDDSRATGFVLPDDVDPRSQVEPSIALLPGLDPTTMGWKQRDWYLDPGHAELLFDRNGNAGPTAWIDGRVVGGWVQRRDGRIALHVLVDVGAEARNGLDRAAQELERLLGDVRFSVRFPAPLQAELLR